jgi:hypothetical protein
MIARWGREEKVVQPVQCREWNACNVFRVLGMQRPCVASLKILLFLGWNSYYLARVGIDSMQCEPGLVIYPA